MSVSKNSQPKPIPVSASDQFRSAEHTNTMISRTVTKGCWKGRECEFAANRIVIGFAEKTESVEGYAAVAHAISQDFPILRLLRSPSAIGHAVFIVDSLVDIPSLAEQLSLRQDVRYAEPDFVHHAGLVPNDQRVSEQWALNRIHAPAGWFRETGATNGVLIGIVDSGISMATAGGLDHPDLNDGARYILGTDFVDGGPPRDLHGHGTHVTGIAAAETNNLDGIAGMNWRTPTIINRVFDAAGNGFESDVADAIVQIVNFAVLRGVHVVINFSGGQTSPSTLLWDTCAYVDRYGMLLCACTHNDAAAVRWPAAYSLNFASVIAVGSTDLNDTVSSFSNFGPEVTVVAPGNGILSTTPTYAVTLPVVSGYDLMNGTSMATPIVTGLCSLIWCQHPSWSNSQVRDHLTATAKKFGPEDFNNHWGFGRVDVARALGASTWLEPVQHMMMQ